MHLFFSGFDVLRILWIMDLFCFYTLVQRLENSKEKYERIPPILYEIRDTLWVRTFLRVSLKEHLTFVREVNPIILLACVP